MTSNRCIVRFWPVRDAMSGWRLKKASNHFRPGRVFPPGKVTWHSFANFPKLYFSVSFDTGNPAFATVYIHMTILFS